MITSKRLVSFFGHNKLIDYTISEFDINPQPSLHDELQIALDMYNDIEDALLNDDGEEEDILMELMQALKIQIINLQYKMDSKKEKSK